MPGYYVYIVKMTYVDEIEPYRFYLYIFCVLHFDVLVIVGRIIPTDLR